MKEIHPLALFRLSVLGPLVSREALAPRVRCDAGQSKLLPEVQAALLQAKRDKPKRSINPLRQ